MPRSPKPRSAPHADAPDDRGGRRRISRLALLGLGAALLAWLGGIAVATVAVRNAPERSALDTALSGVDEPEQAAQPTTTIEDAGTTKDGAEEKPARARRAVEGPCWPIYGRTPTRRSDASDLQHGIPRRATWRMRIGIMEFPPSFCDGVLYVNNQKGETWAIKASNKQIIWKRRTAEVYDSTPAVTPSRIFVGSFKPGTVQALDRATGKRLWILRTGGAVESSPVVHKGLVYATSKDRRIYAINERTGRVKWAFRTGGEVKDSPTVARDTVFAANYAAEVFALNARTGAVRWRRSVGGVLGDRIYSSVPISGNLVFFATVRGHVYALDRRTGATRWQASIPGYVYSTPAIAGNRLYIGNYQGTVYAFNATNGRRLWNRQVGGTISGSPTVIGGNVYVSSLSRGRTWALDARTGRVRWEHPEGRYVTGIATDNAFYLSMGSVLSRWTSRESQRRLAASR